MSEEHRMRDWLRDQVAELIDFDAEDIGDEEDLVGLGLDSLSMMRIADALTRRGMRVHFSELVLDPTIGNWARLARAAGEASTADDAGGQPAATGDKGSDESTGDAGEGPFPLGVMQHAYWLGRAENQRLGGVAAHLYVEFDGADLAPEALSAAVLDLIRRHPMLRTRIREDGLQEVLPVPDRSPLVIDDLRDGDPGPALARLREERSHGKLDIEHGEVIRICLSLLPDGAHRLHIDVDMFAADAMSYRRLTEDLAILYSRNAGLAHAEALPALGTTYREYRLRHAVEYAEDGARAARMEADRQWWAQRLGDLPEPPALPFVPEERRADPRRSERLFTRITAEETAQLRRRARARGLTPAMVVAGVFAQVLLRWSSTDRMLLNLPLFAREAFHPDIDAVVGDFTNSVLVGVDDEPGRTIAENAARVAEAVHTAAAHSSWTGLNVLRDLGRDRGRAVTANVVFTSGLDLGELFGSAVRRVFGEPVHIISQGPQVDLDAQIVDYDGGLLVNWDLRRDALPEGMAHDMFAAFEAVLRGLCTTDAAWDAPVDIPLPPGQAEARARANDTAAEIPPRTLHGAVLAHAATRPDDIALLPDVGEPVRYGALVAAARRTAGDLRDAGVRPGDHVALLLPRGPLQATAILGCLIAGAAYVPIGIGQPGSRRDAIIADSGAGVLLAGGAEPVPPGVRHLEVPDPRRFAGTGFPDPGGEVADDPSAVAYVLFTSGSTGRPKGVEVSHDAAINTIDSISRRFGCAVAAERGRPPTSLALSGYDFDLSVLDLFLPLGLGGRVVLPGEDRARDADAWLELCRTQGVDLINCAPGLVAMLAAAASGGRLPGLRLLLTGGDRVPPRLMHELVAANPGLTAVALGGATEAAIHSTSHIIGVDDDTGVASVPYGRPLDNVRLRVVDALGRDVPDHVVGELWIGGRGVAERYCGDPDRTAERFVEYGGLRWYRTGDLVRYRPDGSVEYVGRSDGQVKVRGFRVELGEIEAALESLPEVAEAIAVVVDGTPCAAVRPTGDEPARIDPGGIQDRLADLLPGHMIPSRILIRDELPVTANGKKDRGVVRAWVGDHDAGEAPVPPANALEEALRYMLAQVIERPVDSVVADFFDLGGDSIQATVFTARVRELLGIGRMTVADVLEHPTVRALAGRLVELEDAPGAALAAAELVVELAGIDDGGAR